jgi:dihydrodipicolinate synthase/N-acetylneuraminate lyase
MTPSADPISIRQHLRDGQVIPAHPLALTAARTLDEAAQRALTRYYVEAGAGGIAVGVHTTQFVIRDPGVGLYRPVLELAAESAHEALSDQPRPFVLVAGVCGHTPQATAEAQIAATLGYHLGLVSLGDWRSEPESEILDHCRTIADILPLFGFYLQPAVGGRVLSYRFWRDFAEIPNVWAVKIAPFNRYQTIDVVRAVVEAERDDIALYTGNDDSIVADLVTPVPVHVGGRVVARTMDGGLLGQWAVWTRTAVGILTACKAARDARSIPSNLIQLGAGLTDANAAIFDVEHGFSGCIPGIHEVLRRQGLMRGTWCLDPHETLSPGQAEEITRVMRSYPWLFDADPEPVNPP